MRITFVLPSVEITGGVLSTFEIANRLEAKGHHVSIVYPLIFMPYGEEWYDYVTLAKRIGKTIGNLRQGTHIDWFDLHAKLIRVPTLAERYIPKGDIIVSTWWGNVYDVIRYGDDKGEKYHFIRHYEVFGGSQGAVKRTYTLPLKKLVTSSYLKDLIEQEFNVSTIGPLANGINFSLFYRENTNFESHAPKRIGLLYRTQKWKGMHDGLKAILSAKKRAPETKLVLFGPRVRSQDMNIIRDIGDTEIILLPYKDKLRKIYNSLDIFVFPSHCEGFGNPPMEAMACGAACVTTNVGAVPDYTIPGRTALVSPPGDINALAANIMTLLENEKRRQEIARAGFNHIKQFTWDKTVNTLNDIFLQR